MRSVESRLARLEDAQSPSNTAMRRVLRSITGEEPSREECNVTLEELIAGANEHENGSTE
jgi:hypothetical protein